MMNGEEHTTAASAWRYSDAVLAVIPTDVAPRRMPHYVLHAMISPGNTPARHNTHHSLTSTEVAPRKAANTCSAVAALAGSSVNFATNQGDASSSSRI